MGGLGVRSDIDLVLSGVDSARATAIEIPLCKATDTEVDVLPFEALPPAWPRWRRTFRA